MKVEGKEKGDGEVWGVWEAPRRVGIVQHLQ